MAGKIAGTIAGLTLGASVIAGQTIDVNGKLNSKPDNVPLENAIVKFYDAADTTNMLGEYTTNSNGDFFSTLTDVEDNQGIEISSQLQAYLFAKGTNTLTFNINNPEKTNINAKIYSVALGEEIAKLKPTDNVITWDKKNNHGQTVANGIYVLKASDGVNTITGKILVLDNYMTVGPKLLQENQTILPNKKLSKNMSTIQNVLMKVFSEGHETYDTTFSGTENHTLDIDVWKTANYKLNHTINVFNIFGERQKNIGPEFKVEFPDGAIENYSPNSEGKIKLLKRFYSELPDSNVLIEQINNEFLGWQSYLDTSKAKINHVANNWKPTDKVSLNMNLLNILKETESYSVQSEIDDPRNPGMKVRTDDPWLKTMIGRDRNPSDSGFVSKFTDQGPYKKLDIFIFTYNLGNGKDIHPDTVQIIKDIYAEQLAHDISPEGKKLIPEYNIYEVYTLTEPEYAAAAQRQWDNTTDFRFDEATNEAKIITAIQPDGTNRMYFSVAAAVANDSLRIIKGVIAGALTYSQHPDWSQTEKYTLGQFITNPDGSLNETFKLLHGLSRYLVPGTDYKNN